MSRIGHGTRLRLNTANASSEVGRLTDVQIGALTLDTVDCTHMLSLDKFREFGAGLRDGGEITAVSTAEPNAPRPCTFGQDIEITFSNSDGLFGFADGIRIPVYFTFNPGAGLMDFIQSEKLYYIEYNSAEDEINIYDAPTGGGALYVGDATGTHGIVKAVENWYSIIIAADKNQPMNMSITFPHGTVFSADMLVSNLSIAMPVADLITTTLTLKVVGDVDWS